MSNSRHALSRHSWPALAAALLLALLLVGCDGAMFVSGRVLDESGQPVAAAAVDLQAENSGLDFGATTDAGGCFLVGGTVAPGRAFFALTIAAPGYEPYQGRFASQEPHEILVALAPAGGASRAEILDPAAAGEQLAACSFE